MGGRFGMSRAAFRCIEKHTATNLISLSKLTYQQRLYSSLGNNLYMKLGAPVDKQCRSILVCLKVLHRGESPKTGRVFLNRRQPHEQPSPFQALPLDCRI
jgi:hypothetical protein